jgi:hypothetical protein
VTGAIKDKLAPGGGGAQHQQPEIGRPGGDDESAAEKAAVYFEEKDRLARERVAGRVDRCVEGCAGPTCAHRHRKM